MLLFNFKKYCGMKRKYFFDIVVDSAESLVDISKISTYVSYIAQQKHCCK